MATRIKFEQPNVNFGGYAAGSVVLHALLAGALFSYAFIFHLRGHAWGDNLPNTGAIQVTAVSSLPLPSQVEPSNDVLTSDHPSSNPVTQLKTVAKPTPDAIAIPSKIKPVKTKIAAQTTPDSLKRVPLPVTPNDRIQSGETAGTQIPMSSIQLKNAIASMAVQNGNFGQRFAYYVNQLNRTVAANWYVQEVDAHASNGHHVTIVFDVLRDGTVTNVRFESHSGSPSLDSSAQHALQRVQSFTPLPDGYIGDRITVEYQFDYQQQ